MAQPMEALLDRLANGRTDLVFELTAQGMPATRAHRGATVIDWCAYYGDVSAIRHLMAHGAALADLGENLGLDGACFHGHWQLVQFLVEHGANVNAALTDTGETPLHAALSHAWPEATLVVRVLLANGADPNAVTKAGVPTGAFMRDARTKGETALHRAAAFADEEAIRLLLAAGARRDARDMTGETPLSWASWHLRPAPILRLLTFGEHRIHPEHAGLAAHLRGTP